jgi:hypothetical protein
LKWNLISPPPPNATVFTGDISEPFLRRHDTLLQVHNDGHSYKLKAVNK